jgi:hypothetical protein
MDSAVREPWEAVHPARSRPRSSHACTRPRAPTAMGPQVCVRKKVAYQSGLSSGIGLLSGSLARGVRGVASPRPDPAERPHCRPSGGGWGSVSTLWHQERSCRTGSDKLGIGTSFLWVCPRASPSRGQESRRPGALRPYSACAERRPVALRPMLSHGLPLSGVEAYGSTLNNTL